MRLTRMRRTGVLLTAVGTLAAGAAGCSTVSEKVADKALDSAVGGDVDIDSDDGTVSVDTGDGGFSVESTAEVPTEISDLVDVPEDFVAETTQNVDVDDAVMTQVVGKISTDDPAAVIDGIEQGLSADGFETTANTNSGDEMFSLVTGKEDVANVTVTIIADGDEGEPAEMNITVLHPQA